MHMAGQGMFLRTAGGGCCRARASVALHCIRFKQFRMFLLPRLHEDLGIVWMGSSQSTVLALRTGRRRRGAGPGALQLLEVGAGPLTGPGAAAGRPGEPVPALSFASARQASHVAGQQLTVVAMP
jgi:hypothetical protein